MVASVSVLHFGCVLLRCPLLHFALLFILVTSVVFADRLPIQFNVFLEKMNLQFGPTRVAVARNWQTMLVQSQNQTGNKSI